MFGKIRVGKPSSPEGFLSKPFLRERLAKGSCCVGRGCIGKICSGNLAVSKVEKEISASEKLMLEVSQAKRAIMQKDTYLTYGLKFFRTLEEKLENRLTPAMKELYKANFNPSDNPDEHPGSVCEKNLGVAMKTVRKLRRFAGWVHAESGSEQYFARSLFEIAAELKSEDVVLPACIYTVAMERALNTEWDKQNFPEFMSLLSRKPDGEAGGIGLHIVEAASQGTFQMSTWSKYLYDLMRVKGNQADIQAFLEASKELVISLERLKDKIF